MVSHEVVAALRFEDRGGSQLVEGIMAGAFPRLALQGSSKPTHGLGCSCSCESSRINCSLFLLRDD